MMSALPEIYPSQIHPSTNIIEYVSTVASIPIKFYFFDNINTVAYIVHNWRYPIDAT